MLYRTVFYIQLHVYPLLACRATYMIVHVHVHVFVFLPPPPAGAGRNMQNAARSIGPGKARQPGQGRGSPTGLSSGSLCCTHWEAGVRQLTTLCSDIPSLRNCYFVCFIASSLTCCVLQCNVLPVTEGNML